MKVVSIKFDELAKKPFQVLVSNRNMKATFEYQCDMLELADVDIENEDTNAQIISALKSLQLQEDYVVKMLKLDEKMAEKLDDEVGMERTQEIASKIVAGILDIPEDAATNEVEQDPKA